MKDFLESIRLAMGDNLPHIIIPPLDYQTGGLSGTPHTWQRVEQSKSGSVVVWLDSSHGYIAVEYEHEGHECFGYDQAMIITPDFVVINRNLYPEAQCYIWRPEA